MTTRVSPNACINRWSVRQSSPGRWLAGLLPGRLAGDARDECLVCEPRPSRVVSVSVSPRRRVAERSPPFSGSNKTSDRRVECRKTRPVFWTVVTRLIPRTGPPVTVTVGHILMRPRRSAPGPAPARPSRRHPYKAFFVTNYLLNV
ncbi:hypothetical protein KGM_206501 [Danaus plexippus plexippus]|uniref:Uncharacterized protein n=1 Tax=Danaus plexippus plexippus TaxID=278856 RepID=A0A212F154_DANPL|nr:hypothetical protein KGM_206501 [Danaus plexippus plexippus]